MTRTRPLDLWDLLAAIAVLSGVIAIAIVVTGQIP